MKIAVCDDNKVMLDFLSRNISECFTSYNVPHDISEYTCGKEFVLQHEKTPFDVVFLDIKMPDIDGFEAAKRVRQISEKTHIIFVTTESELVYDSFDYRPFYFVPKGKTEILKEKLKSVIGKLVELLNESYTICFELPHGEKKYINTNSIIYILSKSNYIDIVCKSEVVHIRRKLDDILNELPQKTFTRIHNRFFVNMQYVGRLDNARLKVILIDGTEIDISRSYKTAFSEKYNIFLRNFS